MKRMFSFLFISSLFLIFLTPNEVSASTDGAGQINNTSLYSYIAGVRPFAIPLNEEFTLKNGESHYTELQYVIHPRKYTKVKREVTTVSDVTNIRFGYEEFHTATLDGYRVPDTLTSWGQFYSSGFLKGSSNMRIVGDKTEVHTYGLKITNYEAGPVTYKQMIDFEEQK
ncbi:hypothetical protein [Enterococcus sp.]|uniref:hypothetical protein n=1 Tax=Enterococcus sp. TaxID=35783 RepID=UPI00290F311D|nr:hypothetical protein [Enterococcus sp.]MDU5336179.1 hypothetical protein [Enterococcus sp.]